MKYLICLFCLFSATITFSQKKESTPSLAKHLLEYETSYNRNMGLHVGLNYVHLLNDHLGIAAGINVSKYKRSSYQLGLRAYMKNEGSVKPFYEIGYKLTRFNNRLWTPEAVHGHHIYQKFGVLVDVTDRLSMTGSMQFDKLMAGKFGAGGFTPSFSLGYKF